MGDLFEIPTLLHPVVQAPLGGGPSTPELVAAVSNTGGLGFLAGGYKTREQLAAEIARVRELSRRPFGVNLFASAGEAADPALVAGYARRLQADARRLGVRLGEPRFDDDQLEYKLELLRDDPVPVVSFTFGCPPRATLARLIDSGSSVWVTVTNVDEARSAADAGATALVVQGLEAGGHRGSFRDLPETEQFGLLALLQLVAARVELPLVAAGGIATGRGIAAALAAGAQAAALGTAFMRAPEAGTSAPHRSAIASHGPTGLTRAFTGRLARGIVNRFQAEHSDDAPSAYPEIHHLTSPLRAHGRRTDDPELLNLWAGQAHELAEELAAAEIVVKLMAEARSAIELAERRTRAPALP